MRTLGHLYEIPALGEARLRPKLVSAPRMTAMPQLLSRAMYYLCDRLLSMTLEHAVDLLLDPLGRVNVKDWDLGDHYRVRRFSVARGDKNRIQSNALFFSEHWGWHAAGAQPCCMMGVHTNLVSKALWTRCS